MVIKAVNCSTSAIRYYSVIFGQCISSGEKIPQGETFSPAESFCCLLFLPTFFWLVWGKVSWFPAGFQYSEVLFQFQLLNRKKTKIKEEIVCGGWSWDICLQGCFGISDCNSPADGQLRCLAKKLSENQTIFHLQSVFNLTNFNNNRKKKRLQLLINAFCSRPTGISYMVLQFSSGRQAYVSLSYFSIGPWPWISFPELLCIC